MKFIDERKAPEGLFEDVDFGEVFATQKEKTFYLRIAGDDCKSDGYFSVNAIDLSSGQLVYFNDDEKAQVVKATLIIEDKTST